MRLVRAVTDPEGVYAAGSTGAVVHVYQDGEAYEVELTSPTHAVVTVERDDIESLSD